MDVLYPRCAALDVHKDTVVAAARVAAADGPAPATMDVRTFETTTPSLLDLSAWLAEHGCTHVAMEATGVYWKPVRRGGRPQPRPFPSGGSPIADHSRRQ